ncbi:MAG: diaminopimelate epimerase [Caulobacter sp.]|nr:diaminopimelate epimerase [Caulobacter sp.]
MSATMSRTFLKMNGLGNDFVVVESKTAPFEPTAAEVRAICDRAGGIGCDQLIAIDPPHGPGSTAYVRFWNSDGEESGACGNGTRCVGWLMMRSAGLTEVLLDTKGGLLVATPAGENRVSVDMGEPRLDWRDIPLAEEMDTKGIELQIGPIDNPRLHTPGAVSMGNPHVVFFVDDAANAPVQRDGSLIEHHPLFPEGVNVGFAQIAARDHIILRVWERGAGATKACGTGACAALVAAARRGLTDRKATVSFAGGDLEIEWRTSDGHVIMTGPVALEYTGKLP